MSGTIGTMRTILLLMAAAVAQAATLTLPSGFESEIPQLNAIGTLAEGWDITPTVDVVAPGYFIATCANGSQRCIDMTGTNAAAGAISGQFLGTPDTAYVLSFWMSGSQRNLGFNSPSDTVVASANGLNASITMNWDEDWRQFSLTTMSDASGIVLISFSGSGDDNVGLLLDDISISEFGATPEPATYAICGSALILLALARHRA